MPKHTPEQKRAKQALANAKAKVRDLMIKGKTEEAAEYAVSRGFSLFDARLGPEYQNEAEPAFKALEEANAAKATLKAWEGTEIIVDRPEIPDGKMTIHTYKADEPTHRDGWPIKTEAVVYRLVPNPRLVVIQLPDKRQVAMLKGRGCKYRVHQKLNAFLVKTEPEAQYDHDFVRA